MIKKAVMSNLYKSILILSVIILALLLTYGYTSLYPNCNCILDDLKTEEAYIKSQLRYSVDKIALEDIYTLNKGEERTFLLGIANKLDNNINISIDIKEVYPRGERGITKSGVFDFHYKPFILTPHQTVLIPINYNSNNFIGTSQFVVYIRNNDFQWNETGHVYAGDEFTIEVK